MSALKKKGFSYATIDKALQSMGIDEQIANAKTDAYMGVYRNAIESGDVTGAAFALANLADMNKNKASALMALFQSPKDVWNVGINRENAKTSHDWNVQDRATQNQYNRQNTFDNLQWKYALDQARLNQSYQALVASGIMTPEQALAAVYGGFNPLGGSRSSRSNGGSQSDTDENGYAVYDKATEKRMAEFQDLVSAWEYDINRLKDMTGEDEDSDEYKANEELRASTGDQMEEILKQFAILAPYMTEEDHKTWEQALNDLGELRQVKTGSQRYSASKSQENTASGGGNDTPRKAPSTLSNGYRTGGSWY